MNANFEYAIMRSLTNGLQNNLTIKDKDSLGIFFGMHILK